MTLQDYLFRFAQLRPDGGRTRWGLETTYRAPHKPLLLLAVLDLFAERPDRESLIEPSPDLAETFTLYWARVMRPDQRSSMALPFFHLRSNGFWHLTPRLGREGYLETVPQIRAMNDLRETVEGARLDEDLDALVRLSPSREALRQVLIDQYFAPEVQEALLAQGVINREAYDYSEALLRQAKGETIREGLPPPYQKAVRDQGFRRAIIGAYDHTCAFCGLRVLTADGHTAADAAHIIPWSRTQDDTIGNGLALCKLCHWSFDEGLLTASAKYRVVVSPQMQANYNVPTHLPTLKGRSLTLPRDETLLPSTKALRWHQEKIYRTQ